MHVSTCNVAAEMKCSFSGEGLDKAQVGKLHRVINSRIFGFLINNEKGFIHEHIRVDEIEGV